MICCFFSFLLLCVLLVPAALTAPTDPARNNTAKRYVIMDNDWGSTGFIPFLLALDAGFEVLALTACSGDTWQPQVTLHALATLEVGNLSCIPVIPGATYPLIRTQTRFQAWQAVHGALAWQGAFAVQNITAEERGSNPTGGSDPNRIIQGAFVEGYPTTKPDTSTNAANFMVEMVHKYPGQVSIYGAGPMTNIALAVRMDANFASLAKELVIQGGYVDTNLLQVTGSLLQADINSDFNLIFDPEAAKIALTAPFPHITIVAAAANANTPTQRFLDDVTQSQAQNPYAQLFSKYYGTLLPFWDETAAAVLADPSLILNSTDLYVDVDIAYASPSYGNLHVYQRALAPPDAKLATYVHRVDGARLLAKIKHALLHPKSCNGTGTGKRGN